MLTQWDYTLTDIDSLPDMLTVEDFNTMTANKYALDERTMSNIKAAGAAIRNYCGWHVYPSEACEFSTTAFNGRVSHVNGDLLIQLPARFVSAVESVEVGDVECDFIFEINGLLRVFDVGFCSRRTTIDVVYTAGLTDSMMDAVQELIAHRVTHALASSGGIQSETAGGVSITYSANWINSARATALADDNKEVLAPYRLEGVF